MHRWLEDRPREFAPISIYDGATSPLMAARFVERDNGTENRRAIIARGLHAMGVEVFLGWVPLRRRGASSAAFGTARDRLIEEMRVDGVDTLEGANRFLAEWWTPFWNERFTVARRDPSEPASCLGEQEAARPTQGPGRSQPYETTGDYVSGLPGTASAGRRKRIVAWGHGVLLPD